MSRLKDKVALVTGCGRGFGEAIAIALAKEGAKLSICDVIPISQLEENVGVELSKMGAQVACYQTDVSDEKQVNRLVENTVSKYGKIDVLVNNVGVAGPTKQLWEIDIEEWKRTLEINLDGMFLCSKAVLPYMIKDKWGRIINLSSIVFKSPYPYRTPYATSKSGVIGFTRSLAVEVGRYAITVNAICPGNPGGERNVEVLFERAKYLKNTVTEKEIRQRIEDERNTGVLAGAYLTNEGYTQAYITHDDVAKMVVFLASDDAARITGQDINLSSGNVMW